MMTRLQLGSRLQHTVSRIVGKFMNCRWPFLKNMIIAKFIRHYQVDMSEALQPDFRQYPDFNAFFTRHLKPGARPIASAANIITSPNDGFVSQVGTIEEGRIFQAKGRHFNLLELLGGDETIAALFAQGEFATLYLSPKDYHRVHMPLTGTLRRTIYIPGNLFAVKPSTVATVNNLFARNERVVCLFDTQIGPMAVILVGAIIVASIHTAWAGQLAPNSSSNILIDNSLNLTLQKGEEMGYFQLGSTAILLFPKKTVCWEKNLKSSAKIELGQPLACVSSTVVVA